MYYPVRGTVGISRGMAGTLTAGARGAAPEFASDPDPVSASPGGITSWKERFDDLSNIAPER